MHNEVQLQFDNYRAEEQSGGGGGGRRRAAGQGAMGARGNFWTHPRFTLWAIGNL